MKKFKVFLFAFCWILSIQVIVNDLGATHDNTTWGKYLTALVFGLAWVFYFEPMRNKQNAERRG